MVVIALAGCTSEDTGSSDPTTTGEGIDSDLRTPVTEFVAAFNNQDKQALIDAYHPDSPSVPSKDNIYFPNRITVDKLTLVEQSTDSAVVQAEVTLTQDSGETEEVVHTYELRPNNGEWDIYHFVVGTEIPGSGSDTEGSTEGPELPSVAFQTEYQESQTDRTATGIVTITHTSGDILTGSKVYIRGEGIISVEGTTPDVTTPDTQWGTATGTEEISAGDSVTIGVRNDYEISVDWVSDETSGTLTTSSGPAR